MKYRILFFLLFPLVWKATAQDYKSKALLKPVGHSGFYQLAITPELSARCKSDLSDIRIFDGENKQVPYIIRTSSGVSIREPFIELPILSKITDSIKTTVAIDARILKETSMLSLQIANNAVERFASISGSNDQTAWYIIDEKIGLRNNGTERGGHFVQSIEFPPVTYRFYKLEIRNRGYDPLNIIKAGVYGTSGRALPVYVEHPAPDLRRVDSSNGKTYVFVQHRQPYVIDQVTLQVKGQPYYKREARLFFTGKQVASNNTITWFKVSSGQNPVIVLDGDHYSRFAIEIQNGDSPPLRIEHIGTSELQKQLVVYLESGKKYILLSENPDAAQPRYDLQQFNDSIPQMLAVAGYGPLIQNKTAETKAPFQTKSVLWLIIAAGILILAFLSYRLLNDMKQH